MIIGFDIFPIIVLVVVLILLFLLVVYLTALIVRHVFRDR